MATNSQVLLDGLLQQLQEDVDPEYDADSFFEAFVAQQVLKEYDLSYDEIESGIVDGSGDGGIDAIYTLVNGDLVQEDSTYERLKRDITIDLYVLQSKNSGAFRETPVERLMTASNDLFDFASQHSKDGAYNPAVTDAMERFRKVYSDLIGSFPKVTITFVYACKGEAPSTSVERKAKMLKEMVAERIDASQIEFRFLGARDLLQLARQQPGHTFTLEIDGNPISKGNRVGFVCLVQLENFRHFLVDDGGRLRRRLFEANVRDYQGNTQVNSAIRSTLDGGSGEDFWWLNNGVSIVASEASYSGDKLVIREPMIVNGLQTSVEIADYFRRNPEAVEGRRLLVRVMVPDQSESRDRIIRATNSQTSVPLASLRATDDIQRDIESYFLQHGIYYDRRKNHYLNQGKPRNAIVGISSLGQAVMAILLGKPDTARARPSTLLKNDEDYELVFSQSYPINMYFVCAEIMRLVDAYLRETKHGLSAGVRTNLRFYVAMHATQQIFGSGTVTAQAVSDIDLNALSPGVLSESFRHVLRAYIDEGANDQAAKGPNLTKVIMQ